MELQKELLKNWSDIVTYDETSPSCLRWKIDRFLGPNKSVRFALVGDVAGGINSEDGYYRFMLNYKRFLAHRVVWEIFFGEIEEGFQIDHKDRNARNNKISNLRKVKQKTNSQNCSIRSDNISGVCGVYKENKKGFPNLSYWVAHYMTETDKKSKKYFSCKKFGEEEAFRMACEFRKQKLLELNDNGQDYTENHGKLLQDSRNV